MSWSVTLGAVDTALLVASAALVGAVIEQLRAHREARKSVLCPVCLGPTDDGGTWMPDGWGGDE